MTLVLDRININQQAIIKRGNVVLADLSPVIGSEQGGFRPLLVIQNNIGNRFSPTVIVACMSTADKNKKREKKLPTHVQLSAEKHGLEYDTTVFCEQLRTIDKERIRGIKAYLNEDVMKEIDLALTVSVGLAN
ncbi:type II toxin-antitoxin system PemK/MazF family toxin [Paenibacillus elgii]|uniref:type II toxin-antitoxin system PemK/MazF family toxin n=1 Tax=Paenibacillus elgii TaxID=189691 RepID=UPI00203F89EE|nr:type II toxin-antitoxin system PemK/MazF family toxin [Paenibacillus elgii]MCM3270872.1 type II toxin-antitoxin system PemK/MazF family toxin [Paenibacillus elgii]